ncbi:MAG: helix-turn-helix transcriptional regulator [Treponema sp.]|jgi:transcriptional regulator with XRE-family HTH domain|nr:helix-turn-helix transcriptional regulator [Treponema sp.]
MNFWERVDDLLERKDKNKKALAKEAGFDPSNISKGIKNGNIPAADTALKIANILGVSVEFLVTGTEINENLNVSKFYLLYQKYQNIFNMLEAMSLEKQKKIMQIVELCKEIDVL